MKAFALFLFRLVTGGYLVAWAGSKVLDTDRAIALSDVYYMGYASSPTIQHGLAALGAVLGIFVVLGFLRAFSYGTQALVLAVSVAAMANASVALPIEVANGVDAVTLLAPGLGLFLLALVPLIWRADDFLALDVFIDWRKADLAKDASNAATLVVPVAAAVVEAEAGISAEEMPAIAAEAHSSETPAEEVSVKEASAEVVEAVTEEHAAEPAAEEEPAAAGEAVEVAAEEPHGEIAEEASLSDAHEVEEPQVDPVVVAAHSEHVEPQHAH